MLQALLQEVRQALVGSQSELPLAPLVSHKETSAVAVRRTVRVVSSSPTGSPSALPEEKKTTYSAPKDSASLAFIRSVGVEHARGDSAPTIPLEAAYMLLQCTPTTNWETIERFRRQLVLKAHPERLMGLNTSEKSQALDAARQVNAAYISLLAMRLKQ